MLIRFTYNNIAIEDVNNDIQTVFLEKFKDNGLRLLMASYDKENNETLTFDIIVDDDKQESELTKIKNDVGKDVLTNYSFKSSY